MQLNDYIGADGYLNEAIKSEPKIFHPDLVYLRGWINYCLGNYPWAEEFFLNIVEKVDLPRDQLLEKMKALCMLMTISLEQGHFSKTEEWISKAQKNLEKYVFSPTSNAKYREEKYWALKIKFYNGLCFKSKGKRIPFEKEVERIIQGINKIDPMHKDIKLSLLLMESYLEIDNKNGAKKIGNELKDTIERSKDQYLKFRYYVLFGDAEIGDPETYRLTTQQSAYFKAYDTLKDIINIAQPPYLAILFNKWGESYYNDKKYEEALNYFTEAYNIPMSQNSPAKALAARNIGMAHYEIGNLTHWNDIESKLKEALETNVKIGLSWRSEIDDVYNHSSKWTSDLLAPYNDRGIPHYQPIPMDLYWLAKYYESLAKNSRGDLQKQNQFYNTMNECLEAALVIIQKTGNKQQHGDLMDEVMKKLKKIEVSALHLPGNRSINPILTSADQYGILSPTKLKEGGMPEEKIKYWKNHISEGKTKSITIRPLAVFILSIIQYPGYIQYISTILESYSFLLSQ